MSSEALEVGVGIAGTSIEIISLKMELIMTTTTQDIESFATAVGTDIGTAIKMIGTLQQKQGDLVNLPTTEKTHLVGALTELWNNVENIDLSGMIDDNLIGAEKTWSSTKIKQELILTIEGLIDGAPDFLNSFKEVSDAMASDKNLLTVMQTAVSETVSFKKAQTLTAAEKTTAISNIGAASISAFNSLKSDYDALKAKLGDLAAANFLTTYESARNTAQNA